MLDPALPDREHITPRILQSVLTAVVFSAFITIALLCVALFAFWRMEEKPLLTSNEGRD